MMEIRIQNVTKTYGPGQPAVDDISLTVGAGEFFFLLGPSGCGKTTLLRIVAGLLDATSGRVFFGDRDVTDLPPQHRRAAMVFQNYALWPHMTVRENVEFAPRMEGKASDARREVAAVNLDRVRMSEMAARKPAQLSGGQQQRVALARALAADGDILLLDEPLSNLDARLRAHMRTELRELVKSSGRTALYVTHDQAEALSMADRIAVLNAGKVAQVGTPSELYDQPASVFVADFLGEANFLRGAVAAETGAAVTIQTQAGPVQSSPGRLAASRGRARLTDCQRGEIICCVRPESISLQPSHAQTPPGVTALEGTVVSCAYLGHGRQYLCRLSNGATWKVLQMGVQPLEFQAGQDVRLIVDPSSVILLTDS
jgi:ABC-type Fe3+/spermidine/putrescine transport system ATPase subunit